MIKQHDVFKVSVIIPVYNAERFVRQAVESALQQPETGEVILIEDGSPDGALKICEQLTQEYKQVKLFRHPGGKNNGASASRNLGIRQAQCDYIAFLDADDYFLQRRFERTKEVFENIPAAEGVYEAVGTHFETEQAKELWFQYRSSEITTVTRALTPEELFETLIHGRDGCFHMNGIVLKKTVFDKIGDFDIDLELSEDKVLWLKASIMAKLFPGAIEIPVAMRRVHDSNRCLPSNMKYKYYGMLRWQILLTWGIDENLPNKYLTAFFQKLMKHVKKMYSYQRYPEIRSLVRIAILCPKIIFYKFYWKTAAHICCSKII